MTITRTITRTMVTGEWALWVESGTGTVAVLMDRDNGTQVWVETDTSTATCYGREYGWARTARIVSAPITIDSTPAGIFTAMMRANASESAAPQSRLYGLLSDYLRRTLVHAYGIDADVVYHAIMSSGECSDDVISDTLADAAYLRGARGGRNYFVTASSAIAYELRHVMQISRDWRQGMTEFATIGQHGSGYWTVTQGHTASGAPMELTDEPMTLTCVTRFADSRQAQAAVRANGYR